MSSCAGLVLTSLIALSQLAVSSTALNSGESVVSHRPNIIIALADDVGYSDISLLEDSEVDIKVPFLRSVLMPSGYTEDGQAIRQATHLTKFYSQSLCTPARAALLTGRYAMNTGLNHVLVPATPAGLSADIPTIPEVLQENGYATSMIGKWHLGHSQPHMTPIGRGFQEFTGLYTWDADSFTKEIYEEPWSRPVSMDWVKAWKHNDSYVHFAEPRHTTQAITDEAKEFIERMGKIEKKNKQKLQGSNPDMNDGSVQTNPNPWFLYLPYTASHSPLQPMPRHEALCTTIPHTWRRQYCGLLMGLDESLKNITSHVLSHIESQTILIFFSDNGGSPWFGGLNVPLRGSKAMPFEGGVRVPALVMDVTAMKLNTLEGMKSVREVEVPKVVPGDFTPLMHVSDWLPTVLSIAGIPNSPMGGDGRNPDGIDQSCLFHQQGVLRLAAQEERHKGGVLECPQRQEMLIEYLASRENVFGDDMLSYRFGNMKVIVGHVSDSFWYYRSHGDHMNSSLFSEWDQEGIPSSSFPFTPVHPRQFSKWYRQFHRWQLQTVSRLLESGIRMLDYIFGNGPADNLRIVITHTLLQRWYGMSSEWDRDGVILDGATTWLFDIENDPHETTNLVKQYPQIARDLRDRARELSHKAPPQQHVWLQILFSKYQDTLVPGDCSRYHNPQLDKKGQSGPQTAPNCAFAHPWIPDGEDPWQSPYIVDAMKAAHVKIVRVIFTLVALVAVLAVIALY